MAYTNKHTWVNGGAPYLNAANLNEMEDGINDAHKLAEDLYSMLVGFVSYYCKDTAPDGWLVCDGRALSRTTYSALFNIIGITFGSGDGSTTFNIPDLRGEFIRGYDAGRGIDNGRVFGGSQNGTRLTTDEHGVRYVSDGEDNKTVRAHEGGNASLGNNIDSIATRPRNVALLPCIYTGVLKTE